MRIAVFDTEATDLVPGQICQLAYLLAEDDQVSGHNFFFSVDEMSQGALEVHGFTMDALAHLSGGHYFEDDAAQILNDFNRCDLLIGHNVAADERYLRVELERAGLKLKKMNSFCTMNFATGIMNMRRKVVTGRPKPPKLSELAAYYEISREEVQEKLALWFESEGELHDARFDTVMTYLCLQAAIHKGDIRGIS